MTDNRGQIELVKLHRDQAEAAGSHTGLNHRATATARVELNQPTISARIDLIKTLS